MEQELIIELLELQVKAALRQDFVTVGELGRAMWKLKNESRIRQERSERRCKVERVNEARERIGLPPIAQTLDEWAGVNKQFIDFDHFGHTLKSLGIEELGNGQYILNGEIRGHFKA